MLFFQQAISFLWKIQHPPQKKPELPFNHVHFPSAMNAKQSYLLTETYAEK